MRKYSIAGYTGAGMLIGAYLFAIVAVLLLYIATIYFASKSREHTREGHESFLNAMGFSHLASSLTRTLLAASILSSDGLDIFMMILFFPGTLIGGLLGYMTGCVAHFFGKPGEEAPVSSLTTTSTTEQLNNSSAVSEINSYNYEVDDKYPLLELQQPIVFVPPPPIRIFPSSIRPVRPPLTGGHHRI
jgi:hypothetical protein